MVSFVSKVAMVGVAVGIVVVGEVAGRVVGDRLFGLAVAGVGTVTRASVLLSPSKMLVAFNIHMDSARSVPARRFNNKVIVKPITSTPAAIKK